jgi:hypothetical protein
MIQEITNKQTANPIAANVPESRFAGFELSFGDTPAIMPMETTRTIPNTIYFMYGDADKSIHFY